MRLLASVNMKFPQEVITWKVLPAIRAKLAKRLKEKGLTQKEIAEILGLTAPAVSQYMSGKRAADFTIGEAYDRYMDKALKYIENKPDKSRKYIQKICDKIQDTDEFQRILDQM